MFIRVKVPLIYRSDIGNTIREQAEKAEVVRYTYKNR
jgi:hypothetical protein